MKRPRGRTSRLGLPRKPAPRATPRDPPARPRDRVRTRRAILDAARAEFAAQGLAGARVDAIAAGAGTNKRMLYHYFGDKDGLYAAVLADGLCSETPPVGAGLADTLARRDADAIARRETLRLYLWEALTMVGVVESNARRATWQRQVDAIAGAQRAARLPADLDPAHLELALLALTWFPVAFPQLVRLITGQDPAGPAYAAARSQFLTRIAAHLGSAPPNADERPPKPRYRLTATTVARPVSDD